jgi:hypothetical protein
MTRAAINNRNSVGCLYSEDAQAVGLEKNLFVNNSLRRRKLLACYLLKVNVTGLHVEAVQI